MGGISSFQWIVKKKLEHADGYPVRTAKPYNNIPGEANLVFLGPNGNFENSSKQS